MQLSTSEAAMRKDELLSHVRRVQRAEDKIVRDVYKLLEQSRRNIIQELAKNPSEWRSTYLQTLLDRVDEQVNQLTDGLNKQISVTRQTADEMGKKQSILGPVPDAPIMKMVGIDPNMIKVLSQYHASLIKGISDDARSKVTEIVRRSMMTGKSSMDVQKELGSAIKKRGAFKSLALRAEAIYRTEFGRVLEMSAQAELEENAEHIPGLKKRWICTFRNSRDSHMHAHNQTVGVNDKFIVGGEKLDFPKDPAGSAANTVHCRCISVPVVPNADGTYDDGPDIDTLIARDNSPLASRPKGKK